MRREYLEGERACAKACSRREKTGDKGLSVTGTQRTREPGVR